MLNKYFFFYLILFVNSNALNMFNVWHEKESQKS